MPLITAALAGLARVVVPPMAMPEASIEVSRSPVTNLGIRDELRLQSRQSVQHRLAQQHQQGLEAQGAADTAPLHRPNEARRSASPGPEDVPHAHEVRESHGLQRPGRITREEALDAADMPERELQLIQAIYRDQALFSPEARAARP